MTRQKSSFLVLMVMLATISSIVVAEASKEIHIPNEEDIFAELNTARTSPKTYARYLKSQRQYYEGTMFQRPGEITIRTKEGLVAVDEAIVFLNSVKPVAPLALSKGLSHAAVDHVADQSRSGNTGHKGRDGTWVGERADRYGTWSGLIGENIQYGDETARDVVASLIIDDGLADDRGHRENIFEPDFRLVGIACGTQQEWRTICVMDFAEMYHE